MKKAKPHMANTINYTIKNNYNKDFEDGIQNGGKVMLQGRLGSNVGQRLNKPKCKWLLDWQIGDISLVEDSNYFWRKKLRM